MKRTWKRHYHVDVHGRAPSYLMQSACGATGIALVPARDIAEVDCARCLNDPEIKRAIEYRLASRARRAENRRLYLMGAE